MGKLTNALTGLFTKVEDTEKRYEKALETKQEMLIAASAELNEKQVMLKDLHKMKILGDVTEATYEKEAEKVEKLQNKITELQNEMQLIVEYKNDDVENILLELQENNKEVQAERQKEVNDLRLELLKAKHEYLSKMIEARAKYYKIVAPERKIESIKASLGMKNKADYFTGADTLSMYSTSTGSYIGLDVTISEVDDALSYKRIDSRLTETLKTTGKLEK